MRQYQHISPCPTEQDDYTTLRQVAGELSPSQLARLRRYFPHLGSDDAASVNDIAEALEMIRREGGRP